METITFRQYARAIRNYWWLAALLPLVAAGAVYYWFGRAPVTYQAVTTLIVTAPPLTAAPGGGAATDISVGYRPTAAQVGEWIEQLMRTRTMAQRVAKRLNISDPTKLQDALSARGEPQTNMDRIRAAADRPEDAVAVANAAATDLIEYFREINSHQAKQARLFIESQLVQVQRQLEDADRAFAAMRRDPRTHESGAGAVLSGYFTGLRSLEDARISLRETERRLRETTARLGRETPTIISETAVLDNPVFRSIQSRIAALEVERIELSAIFTPQHPRIRHLDAQIHGLRKRLASESPTEVSRQIRTANPAYGRLLMDVLGLQTERAALEARIAALEATITDRRSELMRLPAVQSSVVQLSRAREVLEARYRMLTERHQDAVLSENVAAFFPAGLQLIESAAVSHRAQSTSLPRSMGAAGLVGLVLALFAAVLLEGLDERIRSSQDLEHVLGVPVLAEVPNTAGPRPAMASTMLVSILVLLIGAALVMGHIKIPVR